MKRKITASVVASVLCLVIMELALGLIRGPVNSPVRYPGDIEPESDATTDPLIGWKLPPSSVTPERNDEFSVSYTSNSLGFRSLREFDPASPQAKFVFLGDSYTFGSGVEDDETFASLVEERFEVVHCYNMGIGGFGIDQMWMTLRHYALPLRPRAVVLSFIRHDLDRSLAAYRKGHIWQAKPTFRFEDGRLAPATVDNRPPALVRFLLQRSQLVGQWRKAETSLARRFPIGYRWKLNRAIFSEIRDECREAGVSLVVVHIPVNRRSPAPVFESEFAQLEIPFLDLTPKLDAAADEYYYPKDRHFTSRGHRFASREISEFLARRGLDRETDPDRH